MRARQVALLSLTEWESGRDKIDSILERRLAAARLDARDTALAQNLTYGVLRWKGQLDWVLDNYVKSGLRSLPHPIRNALRLGLYQIDFLDRIPPRAAVNESVSLAKLYGHKGTAGLVNAVLRNILTSLRPDFPDARRDPAANVSIVYSHPEVLVKRWIGRYGLDATVILCEYNNQVPRLVARANGLRCSPGALGESLRHEGRESRPGRYFGECLELSQGGSVSDLESFKRGFMQIQDESTLAAVRLLNPRPGEDVIDMCAAPGGKTTYAAELMEGEGTLRAFEISRRRAEMLASNVKRLGIANCEVLCGEATPDLTGSADAVLVDAPCSGTGTLGRRADSRWKFEIEARERPREEIEELRRMHPRQIFAKQSARQLRLLSQAASLTRPGGRIVYSTCSLEPEENEDVVTRFLTKHPEFSLQDASEFVPEMFVEGGFVRIYPQKHGIDGAFAARLVKSRENVLRVDAAEAEVAAGMDQEVRA